VFPATKARLNAGHVEEADGNGGSGGRSARRDALTLFDENGLLVASADPGAKPRGADGSLLLLERRLARIEAGPAGPPA
jgi:hypothetical protein